MAERHYEGVGLGELLLWKCPRCGADNSGPLSEGCAVCASGSAKAQHLGVQPPQTPRGRTSADGTEIALHAFEGFMARHPPEWGKLRSFLKEAWLAAWGEATAQTAPAAGAARVVITPHDLLVRVLAKLESVADVEDEDQSQSDELLGLIAELRELIE